MKEGIILSILSVSKAFLLRIFYLGYSLHAQLKFKQKPIGCWFELSEHGAWLQGSQWKINLLKHSYNSCCIDVI